MAEKIKLKATKTAPDVVAQGNLQAEKVKGHFETDNRRFADHLIAVGYAEEGTTPSAEAAATPPKTGGELKTSSAETKGGTE